MSVGGNMGGQSWIDRVRGGDFSALPQPLTWAKSYDFARLIDGYELARGAGIVDLADFAYKARQTAEKVGEWSGTATELWCILSLEHRAARFARSAFDLDPLLDPLCLILRFALQIVSDQERAVLVRFMEKEGARARTGTVHRAAGAGVWPAAA